MATSALMDTVRKLLSCAPASPTTTSNTSPTTPSPSKGRKRKSAAIDDAEKEGREGKDGKEEVATPRVRTPKRRKAAEAAVRISQLVAGKRRRVGEGGFGGRSAGKLELCAFCAREVFKGREFVVGRQRGRDGEREGGCPCCRLVVSAMVGEHRDAVAAVRGGEGEGEGEKGRVEGVGVGVSFQACASTHEYATTKIRDLGSLRSLGKVSIGASTSAPPVDVPETINVDTPTNWLEHCKKMHGKHCNHRELPLRNSTPIDVILVDVFDECITQTSTSSQYFALSYVWGNAITTTTTSKNLSQLQQPGSLKQDIVLPQTVSDAIVLTRKMGVRYLWVDCLSIIQDSAKKHQHLADMDIIFSQAELTIVAISGKDANAPLSGVRPGTRKPRVTSIVQGRYLMSLKLPVTKDDVLFGTVYDSRGWAFQELIVSKRTLFVTEHQLVFHCGVSRRSESHPKETIHDHREFSWGLIDLRPQWFLPHCEHVVLDSYVSMVQQYCSKRLSFQSDIENAFAGLASILEQWCNGQPVVHGLLSSFFGYSMLWNTNVDQGHLAAANATLLPLLEKRREGFPSWSWVGWMMNTSNVGKNSAVKLPLHSLIRNVEITSTTAGKKSLSTTVLDKSAREGLFNKSGQQIRINIKPVTAAAAAKSDQDVSPQPVNTLDFEAERADWDKFVVSTSTSHRLATTTTPEILFRPRGSNSIAGYLSLAPDDSIIQQATINNASLLPLSKSSTFSSMSSFSTTTSISSSSSAGPHQPHALIKMYRIKLKPWNRVRDSLQTILEVFERNGHLATTASSSPGKTGAEDLRDRLGKEKVLYVLLVRRKGTRWERVGSGMMFERFWPKGRAGERKRDKVMGRGKVRANRKRICIV